MQIDEKQAIDYLTGLALTMRKKIDIFDSNCTGDMKKDMDNEIYVDQGERLMVQCLEIVLQKAKVNTMFINNEVKNAN